MRYTASVVLWGGDGPVNDESTKLSDDVGHVAIAVHETVSQPTTCHLHHARCPDLLRFIYESRPTQIFDEDVPPRGRCDLRSDLSPSDAEQANQVLSQLGADPSHLPFYGDGNCHNWLAAAVGALEKTGFAQPGDGNIWIDMIGKGPREMERMWRGMGRDFVACEKFHKPPPEVVHARWTNEPTKQPLIGKLDQNNAFGTRIEALKKHLDARVRD